MVEQEPQRGEGQGQPKQLYHYTDQTGLDGILASGCMWATHYKFLNDFSEREHGFAAFCRTIDEIYAGQEHIQRISRINLDNFRTALKQTLRNYFDVTSSFIVSFTTDSPHEIEKCKSGSDRLSQWRGYAFGKQGYCLAFEYAAIAEIGDHLHESTKLSGSLRPCIYRDEDKVNLAREVFKPVFDAYVQEIKKASPSSISVQPFKDLNGEPMRTFKSRSSLALFIYSFMKDASFDEEHETRLSAIFVNEVSDGVLIRFKDGQNGKVPYIVIPIGIRKPIPSLQKIVVGPSEQKDQQTALLRLRLQKMGLSKVEVIPSKIPYRNW